MRYCQFESKSLAECYPNLRGEINELSWPNLAAVRMLFDILRRRPFGPFFDRDREMMTAGSRSEFLGVLWRDRRPCLLLQNESLS